MSARYSPTVYGSRDEAIDLGVPKYLEAEGYEPGDYDIHALGRLVSNSPRLGKRDAWQVDPIGTSALAELLELHRLPADY